MHYYWCCHLVDNNCSLFVGLMLSLLFYKFCRNLSFNPTWKQQRWGTSWKYEEEQCHQADQDCLCSKVPCMDAPSVQCRIIGHNIDLLCVSLGDHCCTKVSMILHFTVSDPQQVKANKGTAPKWSFKAFYWVPKFLYELASVNLIWISSTKSKGELNSAHFNLIQLNSSDLIKHNLGLKMN